ncbi:hypothetical protein CTheo_1312 [Ceratobasidium theobromae]|uniref:Uncharacterized protein n=1 Tax=Ceratobasidium theobromae TaxID=1582974 RepID=A0A5N5QU81_9AGAM|nr:hypothetical protein CTheo_1312 [Ceratobasidium theobromae]
MSRPSASSPTVKGLSLTFDDLSAFMNFLYPATSASAQCAPAASIHRPNHTRSASAFLSPEDQRSQAQGRGPGRGHRSPHSTSTSFSSFSSSTSTSGRSSTSSLPSPTGSSLSFTSTSPSVRSTTRSYSMPIAHVRAGSTTITSQFVDHPPRRLTRQERAALANSTQPEMDITDMVGLCRTTSPSMSFESFR